MKQRAKFAVRASLAMATLASIFPLTAYAATKNTNLTLTATVNPSISIDAASGFSITGEAGSVMNGVISASVTANTKYTLGLKVKDGSASTAMVSEVGESIPASSSVIANTSAWGVKKKTGPGDLDNATDYSEVTMLNTNFFTSTGNSDGRTPIKFQVGISTAPNIAAGSYSVNLTLTAAPATP